MVDKAPSSLDFEWQWKAFDQLSTLQLAQLYQLRQSVFIVEQNCPYLDADGKDPGAFHLLGFLENQLIATLRYFPDYVDYDHQASIGRVCTAQSVRRFGAGRELMAQAMEFADQNYPQQPIQIGAQAYLEDFYASFGFKTVSEIYIEDDIPHILMRRPASNNG